MKSYIIGALLGINVCLIWFLGIHLTQTEVRVRHIEREFGTLQGQLVICVNEVRDSAGGLEGKYDEIFGPIKQAISGSAGRR